MTGVNFLQPNVGLNLPALDDWPKNGTVVGQMNPPAIIVTGGLARVQRYLTVTHHLYTPYIWIANTAWIEELTDEDRAAIAEAAHQGVEASRRLAANALALDALEDRLHVYRPTEAELEQFRQVTQPAVEQHIQATLGSDGIALLEAFRDN